MDINSVFEKVKYFIIDMDGTFYLDGTLIDGALDFLDRVHACGKDFCFFTNNSSNNVAVCREKLAKMGCEVAEDKIVISSLVTADYLNRHKAGKTVFLLGNERLTADFQAAGINLVDKDPDIVVLGFDTTLTYQKLWDACRYLANGAEYIATHPDLNCPTADGFMPDTGSMMAMIEASTGRRPLVMGKPHHYTVDYLTHTLGCESQELCFIGDRLETDILIGQKHGIPSVLVLTGVTDEKPTAKVPSAQAWWRIRSKRWRRIYKERKHWQQNKQRSNCLRTAPAPGTRVRAAGARSCAAVHAKKSFPAAVRRLRTTKWS